MSRWCFTLPLCVWLLLGIWPFARCDDWPQWRGPQRNGVWRETGVMERFPSDRLEIEWRAPIGSGYSGPSVADGRVYVTDRLVEPKQVERVHCFDSRLGKKIWTRQYDCEYRGVGYDSGPRASVTIDDGRAYALGAMGHLHCFDAGIGMELWKKDLYREYDIKMQSWGISASPLMVGDSIILHIGGAGACVVALDKKDGDERWRALRDRHQYSAPILIEQAGRRVVVCWTGDSVAGLDPENGEVYWRQPFAPRNMPIGVATPIVSKNRLFVSSFYDGSLMLRLRQDRPAVEVIWRRRGASEKDTDGLHAMINTPIILDDYIYGVDSYGELRCLDARNGDRIWEDLTATNNVRWGNIHFVRNEEQMWMFNERGELIIAKLSPSGFQEISRAQLIDPTPGRVMRPVARGRREGVCWAHPAFADRRVYARNDKELVCANLEAD